MCQDCNLHTDKLDGDEKIYYPNNKHMFTVDAVDKKRKLIKSSMVAFIMVVQNVIQSVKQNITKQLREKTFWKKLVTK